MKSTGEHVISLQRRLKDLADQFGAKQWFFILHFTVPKLLMGSAIASPTQFHVLLVQDTRIYLVPILEPKILPSLTFELGHIADCL